jgi:hypothetical protein
MRVPFAVALIVFGLAGATAVRAADIPTHRGYSGYSHYSVVGQRAAPLWIYQYEPGVITRAYWLAPWQGRHYYPATGRRPRLGRLEHLHARSVVKPAESYYRYWSTSSAFVNEELGARAWRFDAAPPPDAKPRFRSPDSAKP